MTIMRRQPLHPVHRDLKDQQDQRVLQVQQVQRDQQDQRVLQVQQVQPDLAGPTQELRITVPGNLVTVPSGQVGSSRASCAADELATGGTTISNPGSNQVNEPDVDFGTRSGSLGPTDAPNQWHFGLFNSGPNSMDILSYAECAKLVNAP